MAGHYCAHTGVLAVSLDGYGVMKKLHDLVMSMPLRLSLLGQFLTYQTSEGFSHCRVKGRRRGKNGEKKMGKSGQRNAVISCKLLEDIVLPSETLLIVVLLSNKTRRSSIAPQMGSSQILWGHRALFFLILSNAGLLPLESLRSSMLKSPTANGF